MQYQYDLFWDPDGEEVRKNIIDKKDEIIKELVDVNIKSGVHEVLGDTLEEAITERDNLIKNNWGLKKHDTQTEFKIDDDYPPFTNLKLLSNGFIKSDKNILSFSIDELLKVNEEYNSNPNILYLSNKYAISVPLLGRIIKRFEKGDFDDIINEWNNKKDMHDSFVW